MQDQLIPLTRWAFNSEVTAVFEDMLARSIPQYEVMRRACFDIARRFVTKGTAIVDLGCSRGEAIAALVEQYGAHNRFIGLDVSGPMLDAARERFKGYIECGVVSIREWDLRHKEYPISESSVTQSILTLQFTPIEYRQRILSNIYNSLILGGAFILVEKVLGETADLDSLMVEIYYSLKSENGYSQEQIERKRLSLEGVLVPVTARWNEEMLKAAGFRQIDCFWRWMNFCGWVAVKE